MGSGSQYGIGRLGSDPSAAVGAGPLRPPPFFVEEDRPVFWDLRVRPLIRFLSLTGPDPVSGPVEDVCWVLRRMVILSHVAERSPLLNLGTWTRLIQPASTSMLSESQNCTI